MMLEKPAKVESWRNIPEERRESTGQYGARASVCPGEGSTERLQSAGISRRARDLHELLVLAWALGVRRGQPAR